MNVLNRTMRRQQERQSTKKPVKTYNLNNDQVKAIAAEQIREERSKTARYAANAVLAVAAIVLHDKFGFGKKRLNEVLDMVDKQFLCVETGEVKLEELIEICISLGVKMKEG